MAAAAAAAAMCRRASTERSFLEALAAAEAAPTAAAAAAAAVTVMPKAAPAVRPELAALHGRMQEAAAHRSRMRRVSDPTVAYLAREAEEIGIRHMLDGSHAV